MLVFLSLGTLLIVAFYLHGGVFEGRGKGALKNLQNLVERNMRICVSVYKKKCFSLMVRDDSPVGETALWFSVFS